MTLTPDNPISEPAPSKGRGRRTAAAVVGSLGVAAVVGGSVWGWQYWTSQGPQPALALPANTLAYVAVDLEPPGGQKVAAYDALRKFPSLKKELSLTSQDDLGRSILDEVASDGDCDLEYDDVRAWAGDRFALAVVPQDEPEVVGVVQIEDREKAAAGLEKAASSCADHELGFALADGWAVLARSEDVARQVVAQAERSTLEDDADYEELVGAAGDPGVVTLYAAPEAGQAALEAIEKDPFLMFVLAAPLGTSVDPVGGLISSGMLFLPGLSDHAFSESHYAEEVEFEVSPEEKALQERFEKSDELSEAELDQLMKDAEALYEQDAPDAPVEGELEEEAVEEDFPEPELPEDLRKRLADFSGLAGVVRFRDDALEVEVVADPMVGGTRGVYAGESGGKNVGSLPSDSAAAFGAAFADGWATRMVADMESQLFSFGMTEEQTRKVFEDATGLNIPGDLEALGGDSLAVVAGVGFDPTVVPGDPSKLEVAVRISGEPAKIEGALAKLREGLGKDAGPYVQSRSFDGGVVVGPSPDYLDELTDPDGSLGDSERFERAVPGADDATSVTYVDFDAGNWLVDLMDNEADRRDAAPLDSLGLSVSDDGDRDRLVLRVTLD